MSEIEEFLEKVKDIIVHLEVPWPFTADDDYEEMDQDTDDQFAYQELAICFPNLSDDERGLLLPIHNLMRAVTLLTYTDRQALNPVELAEHEATLSEIMQSYESTKQRLEAYGLRAKLSDFQEKLLDYFIEVPPPG